MNTVLKLNSRNRRAGKKPNVVEVPLKLNLGSGPTKMPGFTSVDCIAFPGVDVVMNLAEPIYKDLPPSLAAYADCFERKVMGYKRWPWKDNSVDEIHSSHTVEHFTSVERVHFVNQMYRIMKPGAKATVICPDWSSCRAYGDPTHKWAPVAQFWFYYLKRDWRLDQSQAPHTDIKHWSMGLDCNFEVTWGYSLPPEIQTRNQEYQQHAATYFKDVCQDCIATFTCVK